ncbi:MAG: hypothetical protein QNK37_30590 [Acidobacteriota bacterium]|nr:hypothetical protein [Acidobacteriota bacterium]
MKSPRLLPWVMIMLPAWAGLEEEIQAKRESVTYLVDQMQQKLESIRFKDANIGIWVSGRAVDGVLQSFGLWSEAQRTLHFRMTACNGPLIKRVNPSCIDGFQAKLLLAPPGAQFKASMLGVRLPYHLTGRLEALGGKTPFEARGVFAPSIELLPDGKGMAYRAVFEKDQIIDLKVDPFNTGLLLLLNFTLPKGAYAGGNIPTFFHEKGSLLIPVPNAAVRKDYQMTFTPAPLEIDRTGVTLKGYLRISRAE